MTAIPLISSFPLALEREILQYLPQSELLKLALKGSFLESKIRATLVSMVRQENETIARLSMAVVELKAHPDCKIEDCKDDEELAVVAKREAEQSRRLNALFHKALLNYALMGEKSLISDHSNAPIVKQLKALYEQKEGRVAEVALASLAASPSICDICTKKEGAGQRAILCASVHISLFGPNMQQEIRTVHVAATKHLKEGTPTDLALMDETGMSQIYWVLPIQEKQHHSFPKLFPEGPFHKAHAKMVALAYKAHCA